MSPAKKFFSGNTLEQAVLQAARHFQLEPERVAFEQVERRHGFLKVRRRVVIGVDPEAPERSESSPREPSARTAAPSEKPDRLVVPAKPSVETEEAASLAPRAPFGAEAGARGSGDSKPRSEETPAASAAAVAAGKEARSENAWADLDPRDAVEAAQETLRRLLKLGTLELEAKIETGDEGLAVELRGADEDQLFEDRGRLLLAIEHLMPRMIRGLTGGSVPCRVDSDNFHEVRAEQLRVMAQEAAAEVRRERRMQSLEPMSPDERRIVHLTLADDPAVETESHGTGLFKRVAIRPIRRAGQSSDRYSR